MVQPLRFRMLATVLAALAVAPAAASAHDGKVKMHAAPGFAQRYGTGTDATAPLHADTPQELQVDLAQAVREGPMTSKLNAPTVSGTQQFLPTTWCGTERTTDDVAHSALVPDEPFYKVVYAYASDQPDRFDTWKNQLQANVSIIGQFMSQQAGATKSVRFDMGTSCGPRYLDIQTVALPDTKAYYADDFNSITAAVGAALPQATAPRNVIILADQLTFNGANSLYGLGEHYNGGASDIPGAANVHNAGGLYSALFPPTGYSPPTTSGEQFYPGFWPEGMLHEISHTLGAVNYSAPHTSAAADGTPRGHCTDGYDVMCYADGPNPKVPYTTTACPQIAGASGMVQTYDCGGDDYFNPSPAAGNYLATHWNLYDSVFESSCATIGDACGGDSAAQPAPVGKPRITGTAKLGRTLSADHGTWSGTPMSFDYQWQRTPSGGPSTDIPGATDPAYVLAPDDVGTTVQVAVTATNPNGSASNTSLQTATVATAFLPVNSAAPSISGTARRGSLLTATSGSWSGASTKSFTWQHEVDGSWSSIGSGSAYLLVSGDVGSSVRVVETATNTDGSTTVPSNVIGPVAADDPVVVPEPPAAAVLPDPVVTPPVLDAIKPLVLRSVIAIKRGRRTVLRLGVTLQIAPGSAQATLASKKVRLASGRYRLKLCLGSVCKTRKLVSRHGRAKLPALVLRASGRGRLTATLSGRGGRARGRAAPR
jgi:hypothetical protein